MEDDEQDGHDHEGALEASPSLPFSLDDTVNAALGTEGSFHMLKKNKKQDRLLREAQALLGRVSKANAELRGRFDDMRELSEQYVEQLDESAREVLNLRSENEALRADLAFDHSELLFLKLQIKALEVQAHDMLNSETERKEDKQQRILLENDMHQWKSDWDDVDARLRGRRVRHLVTSPTRTDSIGRRDDGKEADEEGDWQLELCKKRQGRVQSITINRTDPLGLDGPEDDEGGQQTEETLVFGSRDDKEGKRPDSSSANVRRAITKVDVNPMADAQANTPWQDFCEGLVAFAGMADR